MRIIIGVIMLDFRGYIQITAVVGDGYISLFVGNCTANFGSVGAVVGYADIAFIINHISRNFKRAGVAVGNAYVAFFSRNTIGKSCRAAGIGYADIAFVGTLHNAGNLKLIPAVDNRDTVFGVIGVVQNLRGITDVQISVGIGYLNRAAFIFYNACNLRERAGIIYRNIAAFVGDIAGNSQRAGRIGNACITAGVANRTAYFHH